MKPLLTCTRVGTIALSGFCVLLGLFQPHGMAAGNEAKKRVIFVAPFVNGTARDQYDSIGGAIADLVGMDLSRKAEVVVVERKALRLVNRERELALARATTAEAGIEAGKLLKADVIVTGKLIGEEGKLRITVEVIETATARLLAQKELPFKLDSMEEAAGQAAEVIVKQIGARPAAAVAPEEADPVPAASLHFARGISRYYAGNVDDAIVELMHAEDLDPESAEPSFWLGLCYFKAGEHAHAVLDLEKYLRLAADGPYAKTAGELLKQARGMPRSPRQPATKDGTNAVKPAVTNERNP